MLGLIFSRLRKCAIHSDGEIGFSLWPIKGHMWHLLESPCGGTPAKSDLEPYEAQSSLHFGVIAEQKRPWQIWLQARPLLNQQVRHLLSQQPRKQQPQVKDLTSQLNRRWLVGRLGRSQVWLIESRCQIS